MNLSIFIDFSRFQKTVASFTIHIYLPYIALYVLSTFFKITGSLDSHGSHRNSHDSLARTLGRPKVQQWHLKSLDAMFPQVKKFCHSDTL